MPSRREEFHEGLRKKFFPLCTAPLFYPFLSSFFRFLTYSWRLEQTFIGTEDAHVIIGDCDVNKFTMDSRALSLPSRSLQKVSHILEVKNNSNLILATRGDKESVCLDLIDVRTPQASVWSKTV
jgi:hypothetical protein